MACLSAQTGGARCAASPGLGFFPSQAPRQASPSPGCRAVIYHSLTRPASLLELALGPGMGHPDEPCSLWERLPSAIRLGLISTAYVYSRVALRLGGPTGLGEEPRMSGSTQPTGGSRARAGEGTSAC